MRAHAHTTHNTHNTPHPPPKQVGDQMRKVFGDEVYEGTVVSFDEEKDSGTKLYHVIYNDGDEEDFYECQLRPLLHKGIYYHLYNLVTGSHAHAHSHTHDVSHLIFTCAHACIQGYRRRST